MRVAVEHGHERRGALGREELVEDRVVAVGEPAPRLQRAEDEVGGGQADDVGARRRAPPSSSAAASTSGTTAPIATSVTAGAPAPRRRQVAAGEHLRAALPRARPGRRAAPASAWSIGRVVRRKYDELPSGRPSRPSACSSVHSRSCPNAGSQAMHRGCSSPTDGVMIDWCAPPSGASVTPDGVPTRIDCPPA